MTTSGPVLSSRDLEFWEENGYVVARRAVPPENCRAAAKAVWDFAEMDPDDPETWYSDPPRGIMKEIYQHQALWDNRQPPRVHEAFSRIWGTRKLRVSRDRASINPPERPGHQFVGPWLHWDLRIEELPERIGVQGVLYLNDTAADQGAFACIPGFHRKLRGWLQSLPADAEPRELVREQFTDQAVPVEGGAGDLVIWHSALPHGASPNRAEIPRVAQYITMGPAPDEPSAESRAEAENWWRERLAGLGKNEKGKEHREGTTAKLTPLGRKLLGVDSWGDEEE